MVVNKEQPMADRFPGDIKLGGTITITTIEEREAIETALNSFSEETGHEYGEADWGQTITIDNYRQFLDECGYLHGKNDQARYGEFEDTEDLLREAGISYDRHSSARYEYDAEFVRWRPGMDEPDLQLATEDGDVTIKVDTVEQLIKIHLDLGDDASLTNRIENFKRALDKATGTDIPGLEPLNIIDNAPKEDEDA
jgi:hypothetical protein